MSFTAKAYEQIYPQLPAICELSFVFYFKTINVTNLHFNKLFSASVQRCKIACVY
jgi:hypothetical protein